MKDGKDDDNNLIKIKLLGPAVEFSEIENRVRQPPPNLGEHTMDVLKDVLNYSHEYLEELIKNGDIY